MKKYYFFILHLFFLYTAANGQGFIHFPDSTYWHLRHSSVGGNPCMNSSKTYVLEYLDGDTVINSIFRYYLDSSYIDSAVAYLSEQGNTEARCAIVPICFQYGSDTATACAHLAAISQSADSLMQTTDTLRGKRLRNFCDLYTLLFRVKYSEGGVF
ncbi:MAG: hypothetical protein HUU48_08365 [Flavobacteriales bacterium]|nr:hypothetical protein [Flavobacteriales bacterium]